MQRRIPPQGQIKVGVHSLFSFFQLLLCAAIVHKYSSVLQRLPRSISLKTPTILLIFTESFLKCSSPVKCFIKRART